MKRLVVLGSTGSIGTQTLDVVRRNTDKYFLSAVGLCPVRHSQDLKRGRGGIYQKRYGADRP